MIYCNTIRYTSIYYKRDNPIQLSEHFIIELITRMTLISIRELQSKTRKREVAEARQIAMYFIKKYTKISLIEIGKIFNRDHSTVIYSIKNIESLKDSDKNINYLVTKLKNNIYA